MSNKDYTDEIKNYENEANALSNDEEFHSKDLSEAELCKKTAERNYYIEFKDDEGNVIKKFMLTVMIIFYTKDQSGPNGKENN